AATEDVDVQQRVGAQAVAAVHGDAGGLPGGVQARDHVGRVAQHLAADVGGDAPHAVVRGGEHRDRVRVRLHTQVGAGELGDVGQLRIDVRGLQVGQVQVDVVLLGAGAAALAHLVGHRPGDHVTGGEVLQRGCVALHEALHVAVAQDAALAAGRLRQQDAQARQA